MIWSPPNYDQNRSKGKEKSALLRTGYSYATGRLFIILCLKSFLFVAKIEKSSKDGK